jgi:hypothetical protein
MAKFRRAESTADDVLSWGILLAGGYLVFKALQVIVGVGEGATKIVTTTGQVLNSIGEALGSGLYAVFNPDAAGESTYYTATFPNGARHAIPASQVSRTGVFPASAIYRNPYGAATFQLITERATGVRVAVRV